MEKFVATFFLFFTLTACKIRVIERNDGISFHQINDTVYVGKLFRGYIEVDTNRMKDWKKLRVSYLKVPLKRIDNKYNLSYYPISEGLNEFNLEFVFPNGKVKIKEYEFSVALPSTK